MFCKIFGKKEINIKVSVEEQNSDLYIPEYQTVGAAGADIRASDDLINPGESKLIKTGLFVEIPSPDLEIQVRSRSGLANKHGVFVLNSPGTIDSDYDGEIGVILANFNGKEPFTISRGDRIAQLVVNRVEKVNFTKSIERPKLSAKRGGFGSTGVK